MKKYDVLVYGPIFCDLIFTGLNTLPILGQEIFSEDFTLTAGGSAIVAHGLHRLGVRVGLIADLGNDPISSLIWAILGDLGLDRSLIQKHNQPLKKITVALSYPNDRAFVSYVDLVNVPRNFPTLFRETNLKHLHLCSLLAMKDHPKIIQQAHAAGLTVSMDPGWEESTLTEPAFVKTLWDLDIFLPSESELCKIASEGVTEIAAKTVFSKMENAMLIVKQGEKGSTAYTNEVPQGLHTPALRVDTIDTTGAGDSFDAGFLFAYVKGQDLETCMKTGIICGSLSTTRVGGIAGFPDRKEVEKWLEK